jgi:hypothetical protein
MMELSASRVAERHLHPMHAERLLKKAMVSPLDIKRLALRIETLQRTSTRGWGGDELDFRNTMPGGRARNALPDPADLRELADSGDLKTAARQWRTWIATAMRLEGMVRDNDPRNPKRMMRDMARGKIPRRAAFEGNGWLFKMFKDEYKKPIGDLVKKAMGSAGFKYVKYGRTPQDTAWTWVFHDPNHVNLDRDGNPAKYKAEIEVRVGVNGYKGFVWSCYDDRLPGGFSDKFWTGPGINAQVQMGLPAVDDDDDDDDWTRNTLKELQSRVVGFIKAGARSALSKIAAPAASRVASRYEDEALERRAAREIEAGIKDWLKWMAQPFKVIWKHHKEFVQGPIDDAMDNIIRDLAPLFVKKLGEIEVDADVDEFLEGAQAGKWHADQNELKDEGRYRSETEDFLEGFHWGFDNNADWDGKKLPSGVMSMVVKDAITEFRGRVTEQVIAKVLKNAWSVVSPAHTFKAIMAAVKKHGWKLGVGFALFEIFEHALLPALMIWATGDPSWAVLGTLPIGEVIYAIIIRILGRTPNELNEAAPDGHLDWFEAQYGEVRLASEPDFPPYDEWLPLYMGRTA